MKTCATCQIQFEVTEKDRHFLQKVSPNFNGVTYQIPEPTNCPSCRMQRRFTFRNERNLYKTKSSLSGKELVSNIHPSTPWKVYDRDEWFGDTWNGTDFGRDYDFTRPFFEQFYELQKEVPILNLNTANNENCSYCNYVATSKNCYLIYGSVYCEECYYGNPYYSKNCIDSVLVRNSELCYQCITCEKCYECFFCQDCVNSQFLTLCYDCQNCKDCMACVGLRNKQYCIYNKQYTKEEYERIKASINFCSQQQMSQFKSDFEKFKQSIPHRYATLINSENCTGDYVYNSKNTSDSYDVQRCEDCSHMAQTVDQKDCSDCNFTEEDELCYEYIAHYKNLRCLFSISTHACSEILYSAFCMSSKNLFGCIGVKHGQYCILNKQYSKEEYEQLVPRIIEHMKQTSEWGEFFHPSLSYFAYNESTAQDYFPLNKDQVQSRNLSWRDPDPKSYLPQTAEVNPDITQVPDTILSEVLACKDCQKNYKLIPQELEFYRRYNLPVPTSCPDCRYKSLIEMRNPRKLHNRNCTKCSSPIQTTYSQDRPEPIYCENCYLSEVR